MQSIHDLPQLVGALAAMEGPVFNPDDSGELTLQDAIRQYRKFQASKASRDEDDFYLGATIYGVGGIHRYYLNLRTGEVTFSDWHASPQASIKAQELGFRLH